MYKIIRPKINGKMVELAVDERESLTDTLRNRLDLKSVKRGCEVGECGACTVLLDGKAISSCLFLSVLADGHEIITVEGLSEKGVLHPIQQAFIDKAAVQCGFCTPGFILAGVEMASSGRKYSREEIKQQVSGHLCRCTGYQNIIDALVSVVGYKEELGDISIHENCR